VATGEDWGKVLKCKKFKFSFEPKQEVLGFGLYYQLIQSQRQKEQ
jgi:hypothetical protein